MSMPRFVQIGGRTINVAAIKSISEFDGIEFRDGSTSSFDSDTPATVAVIPNTDGTTALIGYDNGEGEIEFEQLPILAWRITSAAYPTPIFMTVHDAEAPEYGCGIAGYVQPDGLVRTLYEGVMPYVDAVAHFTAQYKRVVEVDVEAAEARAQKLATHRANYERALKAIATSLQQGEVR